MIFDKVAELDLAWNTQKEAFNRITTGATQRYQGLERLINYFEYEILIVSFAALSELAPNQARSISEDVQSLHQIHEEFRQVSAVAESHIVSGDLAKLFTLISSLDKFTQQLKTLEYLAMLSEADIL